MSGGKIGGDFIGFDIAVAAIALVIAGGAEAVSEARQAQELSKAIRQQKDQLEQRRQTVKVSGQQACVQFERQLETKIVQLAQQIERRTGKAVATRKSDESVYESYSRLLASLRSHPAASVTITLPERPENIRKTFDEICAIAEELLPYQWSGHGDLEKTFAEARTLFADSARGENRLSRLLNIRDTLRTARPAYLIEIQEVESLRRQYLEEVATARALYAVTEDQIAVEDFSYANAERQITHLRDINARQRKRLNYIYENPTYAMTPEARKTAVKRSSDRIEAALATRSLARVGCAISPAAETRYYKYGDAYLRCTVAENGTVVTEVVGDAFAERNTEAVVREMQRFQTEFPAIRQALREQGVGFEKYGEYAPCKEAVCFLNVKEQPAAATTTISPITEAYREEV